MFEGVGVPGESGEAAGDGDFALDFAGFRPGVGFDRFAEALGGAQNIARMFGVGLTRSFVVPVDDREFITAEPRDEIVRAGAGAKELDQFADNGVARSVAIGVVVLFEVIDIEEEKRDAEAVGAGAFEQTGHELVEIAAVVGAGKFIGDGEGAELFVTAADGKERGEPLRALRERGGYCAAGLITGENQGAERGLMRQGDGRFHIPLGSLGRRRRSGVGSFGGFCFGGHEPQFPVPREVALQRGDGAIGEVGATRHEIVEEGALHQEGKARQFEFGGFVWFGVCRRVGGIGASH